MNLEVILILLGQVGLDQTIDGLRPKSYHKDEVKNSEMKASL